VIENLEKQMKSFEALEQKHNLYKTILSMVIIQFLNFFFDIKFENKRMGESNGSPRKVLGAIICFFVFF
jgi:hypothetical protein